MEETKHDHDPATAVEALLHSTQAVPLRLTRETTHADTRQEQVQTAVQAIAAQPCTLDTLKEVANAETQSLDWEELTFELLSDIVSQQVIFVSLIDGLPPGHGPLCPHMNGIKWKDLVDMIISTHNEMCQQTGVMFSSNTVQIGVTLEGKTKQGMLPIFKGSKKVDAEVQTLQDQMSTAEDSWKNQVKVKVEVATVETQTLTFSDEATIDDNTLDDNTTANNTLGNNADVENTFADNTGNTDNTFTDNADNAFAANEDADNTTADNTEVDNTLADNENVDNILADDADADNSLANNRVVDNTLADNTPADNTPDEVNKRTLRHRKSAVTHQEALSDKNISSEGADDDGDMDFESDGPVKGLPAQCPVCKKRFRSRYTLRRHSKVHEPNHNKHPCKYCDKVCKTKYSLQQHTTAHFKPKVAPRPKQKADATSGEVKKPPKQKRMKGPAQCSICKKIFKIPRNLKRHEKIHLKNYNHPCPHCDKVCRSAHYLQLHMMVHAEEKQHKCPDCDMSFGVKCKLKQHRTKEHKVYEEHVCSLCGAMYRSKDTLEDHMMDHTGQKSYLCDTCGKTFNRPSAYRSHMAYHASLANPDGHVCSYCAKRFSRKALLNVHIRSAHLNERNHVCAVCGRGFFTKQQRFKHEQVHTGIRAYICTFCGKGFAQKQTLIAHKRIHTGDRPFVCKFCGKAYISKAHMVTHEKTHTSKEPTKRPFECTVCGSTFTNKTAWSNHEKRHAGIKDHKCDVCSVAFVCRGDLQRHLKTHTGGKPFQCQHCDARFAKKLEVMEHEASHEIVEIPITITLHKGEFVDSQPLS